MTAETMAKYFDRISEAPDAVSLLRTFILDLAVRGKLVAQEPADEPAGQLLKRIKAKKALVDKEARRKTKSSFPPLEGLPYLAPSGWQWVSIREITSDHGQKVPEKNFTYIDVSAINKDTGSISGAKVVAPTSAPSRARKIVKAGDVIYSCVRPYLLNVAVVENGIEPEPIASTAFAVLDAFGLILPRYLWIVLRSPFMVECVETKMRGQAYPAINDSDFAVLPFPLPPIAEQHRIVAKVDELMALCDQLETAQNDREARRDRLVAASLDRVGAAKALPFDVQFHLDHLAQLTTRPEHIKQLRETVLNLAVRGQLVPQDPKEEPASHLLARISEEKANAGTLKTGRDWVGDTVCSLNEAFAAPEGWVWTRIANTVQRVTVGYVGPMKDQYVEGGVPFLRSQNVRANRFREEGLIAISPAFHKSIAKSALAPGDVVVVRSGNVGTACVIPPSLPEANCSDLVVIKKPAAVLPSYLCYYLNSIAAVHIQAGTVGVALSHFNTKSVATMPLPLPPLAEQHRIVAKIGELMALCDQLEAQLVTTEADSRRLLEAVLRDALTVS